MESITLREVSSLTDLWRNPNGDFYTCEVNVAGILYVTGVGDVYLDKNNLTKLPVQFGTVKGFFSCSNNKLTSLEGAPREVGSDVYCFKNKLTSLEGIHQIFTRINGGILLDNNPIQSGGIGLLLIEGLNEIASSLPALRIINKYLGQGKAGVLRCQEELIENGFEEFAKL